MSRAALLFTLACSHLARPVLAHGWLTGLVHEGKYTEGWFAYASGDYSKIPSVTRAFFSDSPVEDVTDPAIACNFRTRSDQKAAGNVPAKLHMSVSAGRGIDFQFPEGYDHDTGGVSLYLADCGGDCTTFDAKSGNIWFKVAHGGLNNVDGEWIWEGQSMRLNNYTWTATVPSELVAGKYLMRYEVFALHNKFRPQFYPSCTQIDLASSGTQTPPESAKVAFPGAYSLDDPGLSINIYEMKKQASGPPAWPKGGIQSISGGTPAPQMDGTSVASTPNKSNTNSNGNTIGKGAGDVSSQAVNAKPSTPVSRASVQQPPAPALGFSIGQARPPTGDQSDAALLGSASHPFSSASSSFFPILFLIFFSGL